MHTIIRLFFLFLPTSEKERKCNLLGKPPRPSNKQNRVQFHQCSMYSFYARGAQKRIKDSQVISLFTLSGSKSIKAERKYVGEIEPR